MDLKRKKTVAAIFLSLIFAILLPGRLFTVTGNSFNPNFIASIKTLGGAVANLSFHWPSKNQLTSTTAPAFKLFPTGQIYVAPSIIVQPTQIIYPTQAPIQNYPTQPVLPTIIYNTPIPLPTYQVPTLPQQPTTVPTTPPQTNSTLADFGKCLTSKTMVLYVLTNCPSCARQKTLLGEALAEITVVNCSNTPKPCVEIGVKSAPTWAKNNKIVIPGSASLDYLAYVSGCQLP